MDKYLYLPTAFNYGEEKPPEEPKPEPLKCEYPCPCCGNITLPVPAEEAIAYICPVCFWENDVFITSDDERSDENHGLTLNEARANYKKFGASDKKFIKYVRKATADEIPE